MLPEAVEGLCRLGYTPNQARFLYLAGIHSGYFVRRQFNDFLKLSSGGIDARFVSKLLANGHARVIHYHSNRLIYHLRAKRIYLQLGETDNPNRREKAPLTIKRKLMCLDFVLAHRDQHFLTGEDKVTYFIESRGVLIHDLPGRRYQLQSKGKATLRNFPDSLPIYVSPGPSTSVPGASAFSPVVHFAYIDEGADSIAGFETFLRQYHPLFAALKTFEVIYVAAESRWIEKAERLFRRFYPPDGSTTLSRAEPEHGRMIKYFEWRHKFEQRDFSDMTTEIIIRLRNV